MEYMKPQAAKSTGPMNVADEYPALAVPRPKWRTDYQEETPEVETMKEHVKLVDRFFEVLNESEK